MRWPFWPRRMKIDFDTVTYTYYEQLNGYEYLKSLDIGYFFYTGRYLDAIMKVLDPALKTIVHIPNVNSRESTEGQAQGSRGDHGRPGRAGRASIQTTGFHLIELPAEGGRLIKVADLVDDCDPVKRSKVLAALKDPAQRNNRDHVDIIIALGMAKEGFDWIWCEHALTVGYRSSLTEISRLSAAPPATRRARRRARFTNLIAEPDAAEADVVDAINDTLKAIAASLLMEQVLAPRFEFTPKNAGAEGRLRLRRRRLRRRRQECRRQRGERPVPFRDQGTGEPESPEASRVCREDLNEVITAFVQDKTALERGLFDRENTCPRN